MQTVLCRKIPIPETTRPKLIQPRNKPNRKPYYDFSLYTLKQLTFINGQLNIPVYKEDLYERLGEQKYIRQYEADIAHFFALKKSEQEAK